MKWIFVLIALTYTPSPDYYWTEKAFATKTECMEKAKEFSEETLKLQYFGQPVLILSLCIDIAKIKLEGQKT